MKRTSSARDADDDSPPMLLVKRLSERATLPARATAQSAGYDLCSAVDVTIPAKGKAVVPTDLAIAVPEGTYGRVAPRSGLAVKHFIDTGAGVIDADYRGNVGVVLFNHSDVDFFGIMGENRLAHANNAPQKQSRRRTALLSSSSSGS